MTDQSNLPAQASPLVQFKKDLGRLNDAGELALPDTVPFKNFRNAAVVAITDNPQILQCNKESIFKAVRTLAAAGLVPDGREAAIVPFKGSAQAMPMVAGLLKIARNSGKIASLWAEIVYEGEEFRIWVKDGERQFAHDYDPLSRSGNVKGAYAVAKLTDGTIDMEAMGFDEIEKRRKASANQRSDQPTGIWAQWYGEMAKKTVIRSLCKRLPMSADDMDRLLREQDPLLPKDVTPPEEPQEPARNLAQRIMDPEPQNDPEATPEPAESVNGDVNNPSSESEIEDAEVVDAKPSKAFLEGIAAFGVDQNDTDCPHKQGTVEFNDWMAGWFQAEEQSRETQE